MNNYAFTPSACDGRARSRARAAGRQHIACVVRTASHQRAPARFPLGTTRDQSASHATYCDTTRCTARSARSTENHPSSSRSRRPDVRLSVCATSPPEGVATQTHAHTHTHSKNMLSFEKFTTPRPVTPHPAPTRSPSSASSDSQRRVGGWKSAAGSAWPGRGRAAAAGRGPRPASASTRGSRRRAASAGPSAALLEAARAGSHRGRPSSPPTPPREAKLTARDAHDVGA